jgi:hypothetical protein
MERNPHNLLHFAIGGFIGSDPQGNDGAGGLMASVPTAAFDPIFWVHHCNIDRLWNVWETLENREWGFSPGPQWFAEKPWWFNDVDGTVRNNPRSLYMQSKALSIEYDTDEPGKPRLSDALPQKDDRVVLNLVSAIRDADKPEMKNILAAMGAAPKPVTLTPKQSETVTIKIPDSRPFGREKLSDAVANPPQGIQRRAVLIVEGVDYTGVPSATYEVHVNPPEGGTPEKRGPSFVGTLALFGLKHGQDAHDHEGHGGTQAFSIRRETLEQLNAGKEIRVTFIPVPLLVQKDPKAIVRATTDKRSKEEVKVKRVSITGIQSTTRER